MTCDMTCDSMPGKAKLALRAVASVSDHVLATGGGDAGISLWDVRMKKAVAVLQVGEGGAGAGAGGGDDVADAVMRRAT